MSNVIVEEDGVIIDVFEEEVVLFPVKMPGFYEGYNKISAHGTIDSNAIPEEVHNWKQSAKTKAAYSKLFSLIVANDQKIRISRSSNKSNQAEDTQDQPTPTHEDTKDQAATAGVPEISNVQSEGAPETTQVQEEAKKSRTSTHEKHSALKSSEVQRETQFAKKQDAMHNPEEDIAEESGTLTKRNSPEIPENP
ncbi:345_t:CDS:2 [Gigaspora rosea]|nr:345_t:CDS:2 [Gigaspora rosea]